jgi:hypothetical protein
VKYTCVHCGGLVRNRYSMFEGNLFCGFECVDAYRVKGVLEREAKK